MFFLLLIFIHMISIFGMNQNDLFLKAMKFYDKGKYADSRSIFEMIEHKNSSVLYNMGNCYYCEDNMVEALYCWHQAFRYGTTKEKLLITERLSEARKRISVPVHDDSKHGSFFSFIFLFPSLLLWQILLLFVWGLALYVLLYMRPSLFLCFLIIMSACLVCYACYYAYYLRSPAIFIIHEAPLYIGPNKHYHQCGVVHAGSCYIPILNTSEWSRIYAGGKSGWVAKDFYKCLT